MEFEILNNYFVKNGNDNYLITSDVKRITVLSRNLFSDELLLSHVNISNNKKYKIEKYLNEIINGKITIWLNNDIGKPIKLSIKDRSFKKLFINISQLRDKKLESIL